MATVLLLYFLTLPIVSGKITLLMLYLLAASCGTEYGRNIQCKKLSATQSICKLGKTKSQDTLLRQGKINGNVLYLKYKNETRIWNLALFQASAAVKNEIFALRSPQLRNIKEKQRTQFKPYISPAQYLYQKGLYAVKNKKKYSRYRPSVTQRVGRGITLLFHDRGTRRGWVVSSTPRTHFTSGKDPGPVWTGGKSRSHRYSISDRPARSQPLYQLSYPAHLSAVEYPIVTVKGGRQYPKCTSPKNKKVYRETCKG